MSNVNPLVPLVVVASLGCGATAESAASSGTRREPGGAEASAMNAPPLGEPQKVADLPAGAGAVPLHLYVSNQSFDISPVDIDVWIDGTHAIQGGFDVEGQHNWILFEFEVDPGLHQLSAESLEGSVVIDTTIAVPAERWGVLDFWFYTGEPTHPMLTWNMQDTPIGFQ